MFKRVVWATDGSKHADVALDHARRLAEEAGGELIAVHCVEMTLPGKAGGALPVYANEDELRAKIESQLSELGGSGLKTRIRIARAGAGEAAHAIADLAREEGADVIVVGTRGRGPLTGLLLGSVTQRLLHLSPCPVLAIPARGEEA
ncbi:MAG TPA: universal stress protein [Solirubrobacteraceae bacterium]|nr:universal stress protein [Solirubrobacteraceae bacterium]